MSRRRRRSRWPVAGLLLLLALAGCNSGRLSRPEPVTVQVAGSTSLAPVLHDLTEAFSRQHPQVIFQSRGGGSSLGEEWVASGRVEIAATTLFHPVGRERDAGRPLDPSLTVIPFGWDAVALVVHPSNPVTGFSLQELRDLYAGKTLTWSSNGEAWDEVVLVSREDGSGTRRLFEEQVMGDSTVTLTAVVMPTSRDVLDYVATHPNAVGYLSYSAVIWAEGESGEAPVKVLALDGVYPVPEGLRDRGYRLIHPIYLIRKTAPGWPARFADFVLSPAGQQIVSRYHQPIR